MAIVLPPEIMHSVTSITN